MKKEGLTLDADIDISDIADCHENTFGQIRRVVKQAGATLFAETDGSGRPGREKDSGSFKRIRYHPAERNKPRHQRA